MGLQLSWITVYHFGLNEKPAGINISHPITLDWGLLVQKLYFSSILIHDSTMRVRSVLYLSPLKYDISLLQSMVWILLSLLFTIVSSRQGLGILSSPHRNNSKPLLQLLPQIIQWKQAWSSLLETLKRSESSCKTKSVRFYYIQESPPMVSIIHKKAKISKTEHIQKV